MKILKWEIAFPYDLTECFKIVWLQCTSLVTSVSIELLEYLYRNFKCDLHYSYCDWLRWDISRILYGFCCFYLIFWEIFLSVEQYLIMCCRAVSSSQVVHDWQRRHDCIFFPIIIKGFFLSGGEGGKMPKWRAGDDNAEFCEPHTNNCRYIGSECSSLRHVKYDLMLH